MTLRAHAKVNLRLRVLARNADGYHSLETIFLRLDLADRLDVALRPEPGITLDLEIDPSLGGEGVPDDARNLAWRAAERLLSAAGPGLGAAIRLEKRIPSGSGLGGGSSDAAAVLMALNALLEAPLDAATLRRIGGELGSDVPFFMLDRSMALGRERGRELLPLPAPPSRPVLLLLPPYPIGSGEAYGWIDKHRQGREPPPTSTLPAADRLSNWEALARLAANDFEDVVFDRHPRLAEWKSGLVAAGADVALLSGSGSAVFGIFSSDDQRERAAERLAAQPDVRIIRTATPDGGPAESRSG